MVSSTPSTLTALQREVLDAFFRRERGYRLTGGAALAGFHLRHRRTEDLDLFTRDADAFARGRSVLAEVAATVGGTLQVRQDAPVANEPTRWIAVTAPVCPPAMPR